MANTLAKVPTKWSFCPELYRSIRTKNVEMQQTSIKVYKEILARGLLRARQLTVFKALWRVQPCTGTELATYVTQETLIPQISTRTGKPIDLRAATTRELSPLRQMGCVGELRKRTCTISGHEEKVWFVTGKFPGTIRKPVPLPDNKLLPEALQDMREAYMWFYLEAKRKGKAEEFTARHQGLSAVIRHIAYLVEVKKKGLDLPEGVKI